MANGRILFRVKGVHVGMEVVWNWSSPNGEDAFSSVVRGSRASIEVVQDETTGNVKSLYVLAAGGVDPAQTLTALRRRVAALQRIIRAAGRGDGYSGSFPGGFARCGASRA